jgi:hypothetical protein
MSEINLLEVGTVLSIPFGALPCMPLPPAFGIAAGLLPVAKTWVWKKPLLANPARSLIALLLLPHRSLPQVIFGKTMVDLETIWEEKGGSLKPVAGSL